MVVLNQKSSGLPSVHFFSFSFYVDYIEYFDLYKVFYIEFITVQVL